MEEFCEPMTKKHAVEYAVNDRDPESENEMKEEAEGKDQEWNNKTEEILTLVKEMSKS